jgi:hypothetical protein
MQRTPLHYAASGDQLDAVQFLVREGCNVLAVNDSGQTAVDAIKVDHLDNLLPTKNQTKPNARHYSLIVFTDRLSRACSKNKCFQNCPFS